MSKPSSSLIATIILVLLHLASAFTAQAESPEATNPLWMKSPAISPDGTQIAFTYRGQIWVVPSSGGDAIPLTERQYHSTNPVWSPDSKQIAFGSDRFNASDVFVIPAEGGAITRLTSHSAQEFPIGFTPDGKSILFWAGRISAMDVNFLDGLNGWYSGQIYSVPSNGGRERLVMPVGGKQGHLSADGKLVAYPFFRSIEVEQRKRQISDSTTDIWIYDQTAHVHRQLTKHRGNERDPVFSADGKYVYFNSEMPVGGAANPDERGTTFNVWRQAVAEGSAPEQLTFHKTLPVRGLSVSNDGTLVYGYDGAIWLLGTGAKEPERVSIRIRQGTLLEGASYINLNSQIKEVVASPNGLELALVARGDVFVLSTTSGTIRQITNTPQEERSVNFSPNGRHLIYAAERKGDWDIFETQIVRENDKTFVDAGEMKEITVLDTDSDVLQPVYAPTGDRISYRDNRNSIRVLTLATGKSVEVLSDSYTYSYVEGDQTQAWSPDGRYIVTSTGFDAGNTDIQLIDTTGKSGISNMSQSGFSDGNPQFSRDGSIIYWRTNYFSPRDLKDDAHVQDILATFMNGTAKAAFDEGRPLAEPIADAEPDRVLRRLKRLTGFSVEPQLEALSPDNNSLMVVANVNDVSLVGYSFDTHSGSARQVFQRPYNPADKFAFNNDGSKLYVVGPGGLSTYDLATGTMGQLPFAITAPHDYNAEMRYLFDHQWRLAQSKFYDAKMHGVDWTAMRDAYARYLPHISHWEDFADLMAELQGELNASHMFSVYVVGNPGWDLTGSLGLYYDTTYEGDGVRIAGVMKDGPADVPGSLLKPGAVIKAVDGTVIGADADIYPLLNHAHHRKVSLSVEPIQGAAAQDQVVVPVTGPEEATLAYERWIEQRRAIVDKLSDGKLAYVHVPGMNANAMTRVYSELLGPYRDRAAAIVDVRFNVGGLTHDQLMNFLAGTRHSGLVTRNGADFGTSPFTRWAKPSAMVANAFSYSDGSIFPFFYTHEKMGPSVGDRVPGTGTAVFNTSQLEPRLMFGLAQFGFRTLEGKWFENLEIVPDEVVLTNPNDIQQNKDRQLERSVDLLLKSLK